MNAGQEGTKMLKSIKIIVFLICMGVAEVAGAQAPPPIAQRDPADEWVLANLPRYMTQGKTLAQVIESARSIFRQWSTDGEQVSSQGLDELVRMRRASSKSNIISRWASFDLNGDGVVTRAEAEQVIRVQAVQRGTFRAHGQVDQVETLRDLFIADLDNDGRITFEEALAAAEAKVKAPDSTLGEAMIRELDANGDGILTLVEFDAAVTRTFKRFNESGDGIISASDANSADTVRVQAEQAKRLHEQKRQRDAVMAKLVADCALPKPAAASKVLLVGSYWGAGMADVAIGQISDREPVSVADILIETGVEPLHLVLSSTRPTIWRVSGEVGRVAQATVMTSRSGATARSGIVGLPMEKVSITRQMGCLPAIDHYATKGAIDAGHELAEHLGRPADSISGRHKISTLSLPSGTHQDDVPFPGRIPSSEEGPSGGYWHALHFTYPKGAISIDPATVIALGAVTKHDVLPVDAGVAQLLDNGTTEGIGEQLMISTGNTMLLRDAGQIYVTATDEGPPRLFRRPREFRIIRPTNLPAGLCRGDWRDPVFILAKGVPAPHIDEKCAPCVISEATRQPLPNARCNESLPIPPETHGK
jgi:Ca2+-binding EF-hand superfamily protein